MSLFQMQEWFGAVHPNAFAICVARLIGERVLDPGREPEHRHEMSGLAELQLGRPVLQLSVGHFLPATFTEPILAALLPSALVYFRLTQTAESFVCEQVFEHRIPGPPVFDMCQGNFGRSSVEQVCVQSVQGHLALFEAENRVLQRQLPDILHPGPIGYSGLTESLLVASGGFLRSIRYASLISTGTKQVNIDWLLPLGDTAVQLLVLDGSHAHPFPSTDASTSRPNSSVLTAGSSSVVQPSILVLCKRALHCVTHGGALRYTIRLQAVALCFHVLGHGRDARIPLIIGTAGKTLLFYTDTRLIWSVQLPFAAQAVHTCSFSDSLRSMLALLSDEGRLLVGYLGTEPSLFRMPATESRFLDFEERKRTLREFEEAIWRSGREKSEGKGQQAIQLSISMDQTSMAFFSTEGIPSATVQISIQLDAIAAGIGQHAGGDLVLNCELHCPNGTQLQLPPGSANFAFSLFPNERPVLDRRCQLMLSTNFLHSTEFLVPLPLICREVPAQRQAAFKLSIDSTQTALDIARLFPEFGGVENGEVEAAGKTSLGLQPFFGDQTSVVSLFVANKTNRYRIQSESTDFVYVIFTELVDRIKRIQPEARLHCPVPMQIFLTEIGKQIEAEKECARLEKEASRLSTQMRHVETVFLGKLKTNDRDQQQTSGNMMGTLVGYCYRELTDCLDRLNQLNTGQLGPAKRRSLRALLNLMHSTLALNQLQLPFDGRILDGNDQPLSERIAQLLTPAEETVPSATELNTLEIAQMLARFCEQGGGGKLGGIAEEDEEEENAENGAEKEAKPVKEQKALEEAIAQSESFLEFSHLQGGT